MPDFNKNQCLFAASAGFALDVATENQATRKVTIVPYSGGIITDHGWWDKVIFDLSTIKTLPDTPLLFNHDSSTVIGRVNLSVQNGQVVGDGVIYSGIDDTAQSIAAKADAGHKWQMSVMISPDSIEDVGDMPIIVNGLEFRNGVVFRGGLIRECSILSMGADSRTSATIFNRDDKIFKKDTTMSTATEAQTASDLANALAKITALEAAITEKDAQINQFNAALKAQRVSDVKTLFTALGKEYTDEAASPYLTMDALQFGAISSELKDAKAAQRANNQHLFRAANFGTTEQAASGTGLAAAAKKLTGAQ